MLDRSKCKKMLVWDAEKSAGEERIVIEILHDGGCLAIRPEYEDDFYDVWDFDYEHWTYCEEIPEKTKRLMTHDEIFAMMQEELRKGNLVLFKRKGFETRWATWSMSSETSACLYSLDLGKTWHKLEVEE